MVVTVCPRDFLVQPACGGLPSAATLKVAPDLEVPFGRPGPDAEAPLAVTQGSCSHLLSSGTHHDGGASPALCRGTATPLVPAGAGNGPQVCKLANTLLWSCLLNHGGSDWTVREGKSQNRQLPGGLSYPASWLSGKLTLGIRLNLKCELLGSGGLTSSLCLLLA